jgi:hypothetical protein
MLVSLKYLSVELFCLNHFLAKNSRVHLTFVDFVANAAIVSASNRYESNSQEVLFFNCTNHNPQTWKKVVAMMNKHIHKNVPLKSLIWFPRLQTTEFLFWHKISLLLFQLIPAMLIDILSFVSGKKQPLATIFMSVLTFITF